MLLYVKNINFFQKNIMWDGRDKNQFGINKPIYYYYTILKLFYLYYYSI